MQRLQICKFIRKNYRIFKKYKKCNAFGSLLVVVVVVVVVMRGDGWCYKKKQIKKIIKSCFFKKVLFFLKKVFLFLLPTACYPPHTPQSPTGRKNKTF